MDSARRDIMSEDELHGVDSAIVGNESSRATPSDLEPIDPGGPHFPTLRGRLVYLRPVTPADYPHMQMIESTTDLAFRWRLRGAIQSPDKWAQNLWGQVLAQFLVISTSRETPIGVVAVYRPNFQDRHAYLSGSRLDNGAASPLMMLGMSLFLRYVFTAWDFRKLYMEMPEFNLTQFGSGLGRYFEIEGRFRDHVFFDGRYWDFVTLALYRETWERHADRIRLDRGERTNLD
jgi:hypothetical protein